MKNLIIILLTLTTLSINSQTKFDNGIQKGFEYWKSGDSDKAIAIFNRIGQADESNWVSYYYAAQVGITSSFSEKDKVKREILMQNASDIIDNLMEISHNNSEIYTLRGLLLTAYVAYDPMVNGAKLSGKTIMAYEKSIALDSTNPRPYYLKAQFGMGAARFFKQDLQPYCLEIEKSIEKFDSFQLKGKYFPNWGKEQAIRILKSEDCRVKEDKIENNN